MPSLWSRQHKVSVVIGLLGARKNSKRIPRKNLRNLGGIPLIAWTLQAALESGCFSEVYVSTDDEEIAELSATLSEVIIRPAHLATDESLDVEWIRHAIETIDYRYPPLCPRCNTDLLTVTGLTYGGGKVQCRECGDWFPTSLEQEFCLLRPTSPFRDAQTIQRAVAAWRDFGGSYDSLRAIRKVSEHPMKMWWMCEGCGIEGCTSLLPAIHYDKKPQPWNRPTQELPQAWVQTAGLEIFWRKTILSGSLSGDRVLGFELEGPAALDLNSEDDWERAEAYLAKDRQVSSSQLS